MSRGEGKPIVDAVVESDCGGRVAWHSAPSAVLDAFGPSNAFEPLPADAADHTLFELFRRAVERDGEGVAFIDGDERVSRRTAFLRVNGLARLLRQRIPRGYRAAIVIPQTPQYAIAALACFAADVLFVALDPRFPAERNATILRDFDPQLILCQNRCDIASLSIDSVDVISLDESLEVETFTEYPLAQGAPATVLYTSGSTGAPKGVALPQTALTQRVIQQIGASHVCQSDVLLCLSSPCTIAGLREMFTALVSGATLCMADPERLGLRRTRELIRCLGVTLFYVVPSLVRELFASSEPKDFASVRVIRLGGERVKGSDIALLRRAMRADSFIQIGYSSTETTGAQRFVPASELVDSDATPSVGPILPGVEYALLGDDGASVPDGEDGELVLRGRYVSLGYWRNGVVELASPIEAASNGRRVLHTGDIARVRGGSIEILGRRDRQIKINGRRVDQAEIEAVIRSVEDVEDAVVLPSNTGTIVGFATASRDVGLSTLRANLDARLKAVLPRAWHPCRLHLLPTFPRLPNGKIDAVSLLAFDASQVAGRCGKDGAGGPADERYNIVRCAWESVLGASARIAGASFIECGGDSLNLLRVVFEIEEGLRANVQLDRLRLDMTIEEMGEAILRPASAAPSPLPHVFVLPGLLGDSPGLASLRSELASVCRFQVLMYPDWREMATRNCSIAEIADDLLEGMLASGETSFRLLGYSLGGAVAYELASRLLDAGRSVECLIVLDTALGVGGRKSLSLPRLFARLRPHSDSTLLKSRIARAIANLMVSRVLRGWLRARARTSGFNMLSRQWTFFIEREVCEALQRRAFVAWDAIPHRQLPISCRLFRSREARRTASPDLGWGPLCAHVDTSEVDGDHRTMLRVPHRHGLGTALSKLLEANAARTGIPGSTHRTMHGTL